MSLAGRRAQSGCPYLERGVRQVTDLHAIERFLGLAVAQHRQELTKARLAGDFGVSQPTIALSRRARPSNRSPRAGHFARVRNRRTAPSFVDSHSSDLATGGATPV